MPNATKTSAGTGVELTAKSAGAAAVLMPTESHRAVAARSSSQPGDSVLELA
jgi:hypothetical protein